MKYSELVKVYDALSATTKKIEKIDILAKFLPRLKDHPEWIYLLRGRVLPDYDEREFGISTQLAIKAIARAAAVDSKEVVKKFHKVGDLGDVAAELIGKKRQSTLFSKELDVARVFDNLRKIVDITGNGAVDRKLSYVIELLSSAAGDGSVYIIRTLLNDLRVGVADAILRDGIVVAFFGEDREMRDKVEETYDKVNDFAEVFAMASKGKKGLDSVRIVPGRPLKVMLPVKVTEIDEAFRICGDKVAVEHKYDGFRVLINKDSRGNVSLFTRRLDNVTNQFPDVVKIVKERIHGNDFILDSEVVGYDPEKMRYRPFEAISQRIRRKHEIERLMKKLPVEINVFDVIYLNGESKIDMPFIERRKVIEKIVNHEPWKIRLSKQIITSDKKEVLKFYKEALKIGEEGVMVKRLDSPYRPGRRVGYIVKMKPEAKDLDLVIVGAEYGRGKRAGGLTSFILACRKNAGSRELVEVGKASSGLKEKEGSDGTTYKEINDILQPLIIKEEKGYVQVKPNVVVSVTYQNVQPSPTYNSGYAMRFPRITHYRPERGKHDIATLDDIKKEFLRMQKRRKGGLG
ncbi:DNA ligase [Candidatus Pacearchaeota archaeon CG10_big_fil_rev_8_21_14_0_10_34_76]|nr:MAG: DNA ligase [Candidatus Pacearchaeota archaeon CG10_big_fil_rev_8_21_14_0_10_34_76]